MTRRFVAATERARSLPTSTHPVARSTRLTTQWRSSGLTMASISERKRLHDEVNKHRKTGKRACNSQQDLTTLMANREQNSRCAQARHDINVKYFDGGDKEHQSQVWDTILAMKECDEYVDKLLKKNSTP
jgi:hypothetical protein